MKGKKRVLIITYYWPPSGGSGVQRWIKFVKYLRDFGWEPIIYTPSNPERPALDTSFNHDIPQDVKIIKTKIWEPYSIYKKFVGINKKEELGAGLMKSGKENSILQNISIWIRGNVFIPDARKFWVKPSIKYLTSYLLKNPVDTIVSTGPPHSLHLIGLGLSKNTQIPWLADFRDPWTNIDFFSELKLNNKSKTKHYKLEKKVLDSAHKIVVVSPTMKKEFSAITNTSISVIPNGFDEADFPESTYQKNIKFTLTHVGMLTPTRNPSNLWAAISELSSENIHFKNHFRLQLIGKIDSSIQLAIKKYKIENLTFITDYIPHSDVVKTQQNSEALLLIINNSPNANLILTGKLFEYLAAKRPIICISPIKGDVNDILDDSKAGIVVLYHEKNLLKKEIMRLYNLWMTGNNGNLITNNINFSRKNLTEKVAKELDSIL